MSDERIPDMAFSRTIARENGKIKHGSRSSTRFEAFGAYQFRQKFKTQGRNFFPKLPARRADREKYATEMYRLRINGKWHMQDNKNYVFLTLNEIAMIITATSNCRG